MDDRGGPAEGRPGEPAAPSVRDSIPDLVGTWTGTWQDTVFAVQGDLSWEISQDGADPWATGTIDLSALGLGSVPGTAEGTVTREAMEFTFEAGGVGNGWGTITDGTCSGEGTVIPPLGFGAFTFQGTLAGETVRGTFDFTVAAGAGKAILTKLTPVEPVTWGRLKSQYLP